jgi:hypothetical protein
MTGTLAAGGINKPCRADRAGLHSAGLPVKTAQKKQKGYTLSLVTL